VVVGDGGSVPDPAAGIEYGLEITSLTEEGAADEAGLNVGDIILSVNGSRVQTVGELRAALADCGDEAEVVFLTADDGDTQSVMVQPQDGRLGARLNQVPVQEGDD
jgi:S1-C subfamily serine protease